MLWHVFACVFDSTAICFFILSLHVACFCFHADLCERVT